MNVFIVDYAINFTPGFILLYKDDIITDTIY